ncbi:MAG: hypothetical protein CM1200mP18_15940 [Gammaproteobacteria bacterium]|nr:MAG: hypothetical protein CM1200mP18_15940 [Gammaproteobacteria bacterium]
MQSTESRCPLFGVGFVWRRLVKTEMSTPNIRPVIIDDFAAIELLNHSVVDLTSPMDAERIQQLHAMSSYHRVIAQDSQVVAFLLVLGPDCDYDSMNYQWFDQRYDEFSYIDRIVVRDGFRAQGLGQSYMRTYLHGPLTRRSETSSVNTMSNHSMKRRKISQCAGLPGSFA